MLRLKAVFNTFDPTDPNKDMIAWDYITMDGSHWDNSGLDFFIDKAFNVLAPGESKIKSRDFPSQCQRTIFPAHAPTYRTVPRRYDEVITEVLRKHFPPPAPSNFHVQATYSDVLELTEEILRREG